MISIYKSFKKLIAVVILISANTAGMAQNNALQFSGGNDNVTLTYNAALDFSLTSKFSIEGWFKTTNFTAVLYSNIIDISPFVGHEVAVVNNKVVFSIANNYLTSMIRVETIANYNDGNWHHFATVYKGVPTASNVDIYVDGAIQSVSVTNNNLSGPPSTGNAPHIGCRNNTAYFLSGELDEIRVWNKALCSLEINARKNCELSGNEPNLVAYYNFNQGVPSANNAGVTNLPDVSGNGNSGTLSGFALTGSTSNWITSSATMSGTCNYVGPITITGNSTVCAGNPNILTGNGATSYTWNTTATSSSISVSPTVTTAYSVSATNTVNGCYGNSSFTLTVNPCTGLQERAKALALNLSPNPTTGLLTLTGTEAGMTIEIYNVVGSLVFAARAESDSVQLDISSQNSGIYLIKCYAPGRVYVSKVIKY